MEKSPVLPREMQTLVGTDTAKASELPEAMVDALVEARVNCLQLAPHLHGIPK